MTKPGFKRPLHSLSKHHQRKIVSSHLVLDGHPHHRLRPLGCLPALNTLHRILPVCSSHESYRTSQRKRIEKISSVRSLKMLSGRLVRTGSDREKCEHLFLSSISQRTLQRIERETETFEVIYQDGAGHRQVAVDSVAQPHAQRVQARKC